MTTTLALLLLAQTTPAPPPAAADELRVVDVSALGGRYDEIEEENYGTQVFPLADVSSADVWGDQRGAGTGLEFLELVELARQLHEDEFDYEGRRFRVNDGGDLLVMGPAALHDGLAAALAEIAAAANAEARLAIDVYDVPPQAQGDLSAEGLARLGAPRERYSVPLRTDRVGHVDTGRAATVVADYGVEIANASAIHDPHVVDVRAGMQIQVAASATGSGIRVALAMKCTGVASGERERGVAMSTVHMGDDGILKTRDPVHWREATTIRGAALATELHLAPGESRVVSWRLADGGVQAAVLRAVGSLPVAHAVGGSTASALIVDGGVLSPVGMAAVGSLLDGEGRLDVRADADGDWGTYEGALRAYLQGPEHDATTDFLATVGGPDLVLDEVGPWTIAAAREREGGGTEALDRVAAMLESVAAPSTLDVALRLDAPDGTSWSATVPAVSGSSVATAVGEERFAVFDYDVELAERSAATDLDVRLVHEGFVVWLRPSRVGADGLVLDVAAAGAHTTEDGRAPVDDDATSYLDRREGDQLRLRTRRTLQRADGAWTAVFGDENASQGLRLTVRVTE